MYNTKIKEITCMSSMFSTDAAKDIPITNIKKIGKRKSQNPFKDVSFSFLPAMITLKSHLLFIMLLKNKVIVLQ
jgi:hypothetical protein